MNRKEIGKWISVFVLAIVMSISFQTEIVNAEIIEDESIENTIPQEETSDEKGSEDETVENISDETVVVNTDVNFYIQLDNAVMDVEDYPVELKDISGRWSEDAVTKCVRAGIINGFPDGSFKPTNTLTREQLCAVIYKVLQKI